MFHPADHPLERGWVGRIDGERVVHLAAQTLSSLFTGGGAAREHAEYALAEVRLLAPVLHPPSIRVFEDRRSFAFANPAAVIGPDEPVSRAERLVLHPRLAAVVGADGAIAGFTAVAEWRRPDAPPPKDRDFALGSGPVVVTSDELGPDALRVVVRAGGEPRAEGVLDRFDWTAARDFAAEGTSLRPGDLLVGPACAIVEGLRARSMVELEVEAVGVLRYELRPD